jgi:redox-sensitive bicupin YhaK (pirin superfamily)
MAITMEIEPLQAIWQTLDPFLFCAHHDDAYPPGNEDMGPEASLAGRDIGQDFSRKDGWSMYHGDAIPGFPQHPHRGFETVTVARHGYIDHSDSLGASARFGDGDLQWMTAGRGIVHSEMFPLVHRDRGNRTELFQIWLNLPARNKMVEPYFSLFWKNEIPVHHGQDGAGREFSIVSYAGALSDGQSPPTPPPASWAAQAENAVVIWTIKLAPEANWTLPGGDHLSNRRLYFFRGQQAAVADQQVSSGHAITLPADADIAIANGTAESEFLLLQGRPIGEPTAQYGPFVMNSQHELHEAFRDYQRTGFGGWPWPDHGPAHPREQTRFARYPDGRVIEAPAG